MATVGPEEFYITRQEEALYVAAGSTGVLVLVVLFHCRQNMIRGQNLPGQASEHVPAMPICSCMEFWTWSSNAGKVGKYYMLQTLLDIVLFVLTQLVGPYSLYMKDLRTVSSGVAAVWCFLGAVRIKSHDGCGIGRCVGKVWECLDQALHQVMGVYIFLLFFIAHLVCAVGDYFDWQVVEGGTRFNAARRANLPNAPAEANMYLAVLVVDGLATLVCFVNMLGSWSRASQDQLHHARSGLRAWTADAKEQQQLAPVAATGAGAAGPGNAVAQWDFTPQDAATQLPLTAGERLQVLECTDSDWWTVCPAGGLTRGLCPAAYIQPDAGASLPGPGALALQAASAAAPAAGSAPAPAPAASTASTQGTAYRAAFDFAAQEENQMALSAGEAVTVTDKPPGSDWWMCSKAAGPQSGFVPAAYLVEDQQGV